MRNVTFDTYIRNGRRRDDISNIILLLKQGQKGVCGPRAPSYCTTTAKSKERERGEGDLAAKHVQQLKTAMVPDNTTCMKLLDTNIYEIRSKMR